MTTALSAELRALRIARGLSLGEAALRAGASKSALSAWENGTTCPRGPALARLLDVLEAEPRPRARLIHAADPAFARFALAHSPFGAPVDVGMVVRAMRDRRGMTQADLARRVGVTQAAVSQWETGESVPGGTLLHAAAFALGATPEEAVALASARGEPMGALPDDPEAARDYLRSPARAVPVPLKEVVLLGLEAELWRRSVRDPRWDPLYCRVVGDRASDLFCLGRLGEVEETARRALRRATTPDAREEASAAVGTLIALARHADTPRAPLAARLAGWIERLPGRPSLLRSWMVWERARLLARMGGEDEALDATERAVEELWATSQGDALETEYNARKYRAETLLETSRPERAAELYSSGDEGHALVAIPCWHAAGRAVPAGWLAKARYYAERDGNIWMSLENLEKWELDQARLMRA